MQCRYFSSVSAEIHDIDNQCYMTGVNTMNVDRVLPSVCIRDGVSETPAA